jgi:hypothetical protein
VHLFFHSSAPPRFRFHSPHVHLIIILTISPGRSSSSTQVSPLPLLCVDHQPPSTPSPTLTVTHQPTVLPLPPPLPCAALLLPPMHRSVRSIWRDGSNSNLEGIFPPRSNPTHVTFQPNTGSWVGSVPTHVNHLTKYT